MNYKIKDNKYLHFIFSFLLSYLLTFSIFKFFNIAFPYSEVIFLISMFGIWMLISNSQNITDKNTRIGSAVFSTLLSMSFVIGRKINLWQKPYFQYFKFTDIIYFLLLTVFLFFVILNVLNFVCRVSLNVEAPKEKASYKFWLIIFLIFVISWLPYLFIYYPGNLSSDSYWSINQCIGECGYNNHHPIAFTMFVNIFIHFGLLFRGLNFGIACFSFAQLLILALVLSFSVYWLKKKGFQKYILVLVTLFFAFNPVIAMYSITMWKDILFSAWILLLVLLLYDIIESDGKLLCSGKGLCLLSFISLLVAFWRNNGFYVVIAIFIILAVYFRRYYKLLLPTFLAIIAFICIIQGPGYKLMGIAQGNFAESVGIPLQQIGYTLEQNGKINEEQKASLDSLLDTETMAKEYGPISPDYIKFNKDFNNEFLNNNKSEFLKIWLSILPSNWLKYIKAWLMQTIGYYHIGTTNWIVLFSAEPYGNRNKMIHNTDFIYKIFSINLQPILHKMFQTIKYIPVIGNIYSIAFMFWTTVFCSLTIFLKKRSKYIIPLIPLFAIWGTMMIAAPTFCEFRYMFAFHLTLPIVILLLFMRNDK